MAHFAILCPQAAGHLFSDGSLGVELAGRGHRVTVIGQRVGKSIVDQLGLDFHELPEDAVRYRSSALLWCAFRPFGANWLIEMRDVFRWQADTLLQLVPPVLKQLSVDALLVDQVCAAGGTVAEHVDIPFVTICSALPWHEEANVPPPFRHWLPADGGLATLRNRLGYLPWRWYMQPVLKLINRYRKVWGLRRFRHIDETYSPSVQLCQLCRELDFPDRNLPSTFHYVGPLAAHRAGGNVAFPWERLDGRPLVFASLGTVADPFNVPIFQKIVAACHGLDAQLVLALGRWSDDDRRAVREKLGPIPENAVIVDFAPQLALLEKTGVFITHAGQNSTMEGLSRGVPLVAIPRSADQPGIAARVEYVGAGLRAFFRTVTPDELRDMIRRVLTDDRFRRKAGELQQAIAAAGGAGRAADIIEDVLRL